MKIYLTDVGAALLQNAQSNNNAPKPKITGSQIYSSYGFIPDNSSPDPAYVLVDNKDNPGSIKYTPINTHELLLSVRLDQTYEFEQLGSILLFLNNTPLLWAISDRPIHKLKTNPVSHFAGDEYFFDYLFRYPYIRSLVDTSNLEPRIAKFIDFATISEITVSPHTLSNQALLEQNTLFYGKNSPAILSRNEDGNWIGSTFMNPIDADLFKVDSGSTKSGQ